MRYVLTVRVIDEHIQLRPAAASDTEFARTVHHRALRKVVVRQFGPWDEDLQDTFFEQSGFPHGCEIIEFDQVPCGYLQIAHAATHVDVRNLYIDPSYQRKRIGTRILKNTIDLAADSKLPVRLLVLHENTEAAALYRRLGFEVVGRTDTHFQMWLQTEAT